MLLQIAANLANDVFDYEKGADTHERLGPTRAVQAGLLSARSVRRALVIVLGLALGVGVYLTAVAGWPVVVIGLLSIASALAYTGGPFPLGYHGLGDVFVMLFFGFVAVAATTWVQAAEIPPVTWLAALAVGSLATAVLVVNNLRDRDTDVRAGKRTLAVRFGKEAAIWEYKLLLGVALTMPLVVVYTRLGPVTVLLAAVTLPRALMLMMQIRRRDGKHLNPILVSTAQLLLTYGLSLAAGIALGGQRFG
jgi:1,4-dihydroxy-2-naphthoate octaprenyltransferase